MYSQDDIEYIYKTQQKELRQQRKEKKSTDSNVFNQLKSAIGISSTSRATNNKIANQIGSTIHKDKLITKIYLEDIQPTHNLVGEEHYLAEIEKIQKHKRQQNIKKFFEQVSSAKNTNKKLRSINFKDDDDLPDVNMGNCMSFRKGGSTSDDAGLVSHLNDASYFKPKHFKDKSTSNFINLVQAYTVGYKKH